MSHRDPEVPPHPDAVRQGGSPSTLSTVSTRNEEVPSTNPANKPKDVSSLERGEQQGASGGSSNPSNAAGVGAGGGGGELTIPPPPGPPSSTHLQSISELFTRAYLMTPVDPAQSTWPLVIYCFMTGYIDAVAYSAIFIWAGFQTGNTVQLSIAIARLFQNLPYGSPTKHDHEFHRQDQQALTSLLSFNLGAFVARIGDKIGATTRLWLFLGSFIQTLSTMIAAIFIYKADQGSVAMSRDHPAWSNGRTFVGLGFLSASLGLQGIMAKRLNTQFATTVVLTSVWVELMCDPKLFVLGLVKNRDHKAIAIGALFLGGFSGRALTESLGVGGTLGIAVGIRMVGSLWWLIIPAKSK